VVAWLALGIIADSGHRIDSWSGSGPHLGGSGAIDNLEEEEGSAECQ